ncbi:hypothetical protein [Ideonella sp.]|uniref:hypothetical protein n=1 Tax=Ideonella sp. TaxID=1929293 RepID=UPI002B45B811|nr:hypothetical protein [Ideonella sp.]HJV70884.1 hypothetical protein [Ideonella sp.]
MEQKNILLLTATITPMPGLPSLARVDPKARLDDYLTALRFYAPLLGRCFDAIVFAENSNSDVQALKDHVRQAGVADRVEFVSFDGLDFPASHGRGYGEFKLVDHAMAHSAILRERSDAVVWKCTGRYVVENIEQLVRGRPPVDLYCHKRDYPYRLCELFMLSYTAKGYDRLIRGVYRQLCNDVVPGVHSTEEVLFRTIIDAATRDATVCPRFRSTPLIRAIRGWNNASYRSRTDPRIILRQVANVIAPWLWI